ncbi:MAG: ATP synthase subunit I [Lachnospiraceae bacterium]|nr:ATP synthase subunit I [Lachnospiraceae bacterium]
MKEKWIEHYTLIELWIGILLFGVAIEAVLLAAFDNKLYRSIGLLAGLVGAILMAAHMEYTINRALSAGEAGAEKTMRLGYLLRYFTAALAMITAAVSGLADPIMIFVGLMTLKFSAYIEPYTHRISEKVCGKEPFFREMVSAEEQDRLYGKKKETDNPADGSNA